MVIFTYPLFWYSHAFCAAFAMTAGIVVLRRTWLRRTLRVILLLLAAFSALLFYAPQIVSWLFDFRRSPFPPFIWLFEVSIPVGCFFLVGVLLRKRFTPRV